MDVTNSSPDGPMTILTPAGFKEPLHHINRLEDKEVVTHYTSYMQGNDIFGQDIFKVSTAIE